MPQAKEESAGEGSFDRCNMHEVVYLLHSCLWVVLFFFFLLTQASTMGFSEKCTWVDIILNCQC